MAIEHGIAEKVKVIDSGGNDLQADLGLWATAVFHMDEELIEDRSVDSGGKPVSIGEGPVEFPASLTLKPTTLKALRLMGKYAEDGGAGTWEITFPEDEQLEKHQSFQGQITNLDEDAYFDFSNVKFGEFNFEVGIGDTLLINYPTVLAEDGKIVRGSTLTVTEASGTPLRWKDLTFKIDDTAVGTIESVSPRVNRNIQSEHGITDATGAEALKPVAVSEGNYEMMPRLVLKVEDTTAWQEAIDDSSGDLEIQDSKTSKKISFDFGSTEGELIFQNGKFIVNEYEMSDDKSDTRLIELQGRSLDVKVEGSL